MKKIYEVIILGLMSSLLFSLSCSNSVNGTNPSKDISFTQSGNSVNNSAYLKQSLIQNDEITLEINIKGGQNVCGAALEIAYDAGKISYVSSSKGTYLNWDGDENVFQAKLFNDKEGILLIGIDRKDINKGVSGDGILCYVILKCLTDFKDVPVEINSSNNRLKSPDGDISGTVWLGGSLSYK